MSHTTVNAAQVLAACDSYLKKREKIIQRERDEMIEKARRPFWRRLLGLPPLTPERARKRLESDSWGYMLIELSGGHPAAEVTRLRSLALAALQSGAGGVMLSDEHAHILENYWH